MHLRPREDPRVDRGVGCLERSGVVPRRDDQAAVRWRPAAPSFKVSGRQPSPEAGELILQGAEWEHGNGSGLGTGIGISIGPGDWIGNTGRRLRKMAARRDGGQTDAEGRGCAVRLLQAARSAHVQPQQKPWPELLEQPGRSYRDAILHGVVPFSQRTGREKSYTGVNTVGELAPPDDRGNSRSTVFGA